MVERFGQCFFVLSSLPGSKKHEQDSQILNGQPEFAALEPGSPRARSMWSGPQECRGPRAGRAAAVGAGPRLRRGIFVGLPNRRRGSPDSELVGSMAASQEVLFLL